MPRNARWGSMALLALLLTGCRMDWSPDGARLTLLVTLRHGQQPYDALYAIRIDGSDPRRVCQTSPDADTSALIPRWSHDGRRLAVQSEAGPETAVTVYNADGRGGVRLLSRTAQ